MKLMLYDYFRSSASFRVRIALNLKNLDYQIIPIHLLNNGGEQFKDSYVALNPHSLVPTLQIDQQTLTQSIAIIEYLDEIQPEPTLLPHHPFEKALVRSFALSIAADIHPLNNLRILKYITNEFHISEEQKKQWIQHWISLGFDGLEKQLSTRKTTGPFCFGSQPTLADICLVPQMFNANRFECDLTRYPTLLQINEHCQQLPAFANAWPIESN